MRAPSRQSARRGWRRCNTARPTKLESSPQPADVRALDSALPDAGLSGKGIFVRSRSGLAIAYAGAALIAAAGILLSVLVFLQTAHSVGPQSSRPPASTSPRTLPSTGPTPPVLAGRLAAPPGPSDTSGRGRPASRLYPPGEPPGDVEDQPSAGPSAGPAPGPSPAGPIAGLPQLVPRPTPAPLPVVSPPLFH